MMTIRNYTSYPIEGLLRFILDRYMPSYQGTLVVCHNNAALKRYSTPSVELEALLYRNGLTGNQYTMILREGPGTPERIVCHEMVHLMQFLRRDLSLDLQSRTFTWRGKSYPASLKYEDRPWESEAFGMEGIVLRNYKSAKKRKTCK